MLKEFREFAIRGNVIDMAVGVIIGGAFGKIVSSLVNDILMPPLGLLVSKVNFAALCFDLNTQRFTTIDAAKASGATTINLGLFINTVIDFVIQAFVIFMMIQFIQRLKQRTFLATPAPTPDFGEPGRAAAPTTKTCPFCCSTIAIKAVRCPQCTSELQSALVPTAS
ncbi:MAG: large conductance mechanosensitive channel protein MscL [Verrucomicrobia bacterium]|nr:large conductance mechanosensitive channel protein MscL [Verrucomicrobiota bacterium]MBU1734521.1 large conductance mechanosensitive channel protein MscL [Verrucomicrobiota bacterium]MBU1857880.1 large conductance mechanosensitive channel protein MscL [Verrucomicrobiota bacterium]